MALVRRLALALVTPLVATLTVAAPAVAQSTYTWSNSGASDWLNAGNWSGSPSNFPGITNSSTGNNAGDTAVFAGTLPSGNAVGIDMSSTGTPALLQLGVITFSNTSNSLTVGNSSATDGTLRLNGVTVGGQSDTVLSNTSGTQTLTIQSPSLTLRLGTLTNGVGYVFASSGSTISISTPITDGGTPKGITVQGGGIVTLSSGASDYTGTTLVQQGTLHVTNTSGTATGTGPVSVNAGAKLSGTGRIAPTSGTVDSGGTIQPGTDAATGTLTIIRDTQLTGGSSKYQWSLSAAGTGSSTQITNGESDPGSNTSRLAVTGTLNFQPATIDIVGLSLTGFNNLQYYSWTVATGTTVQPILAQPTFNTTGLNTGGGMFTLSAGVGSVIVSFAPAPEPASILFFCGIAAGLTGYVRRKRARSRLDVNTAAI